MITITDCIGLTELTPEEIDAIAEHEHMPFITALEKGAFFLENAWGNPAIRQMIYDDMKLAESEGRSRHALELALLYREACARHAGGSDRRHIGPFVSQGADARAISWEGPWEGRA